ncbi:MAG: glutamate racemase [Chitinophagaceae bacterium]|nr:MAG: glutamate racemase [Chitinophagaceae bacterium]
MKTSQPIGIFDSGIGGLTVASDISKYLPNEDIIYFGDTAHLPYGDKSTQTIQSYSKRIVEFLLEKKCKAIVVACNSASSMAFDFLAENFSEKCLLFNVIDPITDSIIKNKSIKKVGVIGTKATIYSGIYENILKEHRSDLVVASLSTPLLAPMVESGYFNNKISRTIIENYLKYPDFENIDGLILACTHYPLIKNDIKKVVGNNIQLFDSTDFLADQLKENLSKNKILNTSKTKGKTSFFVSDWTESFAETASIFYGKEIKLELAQIFRNSKNEIF